MTEDACRHWQQLLGAYAMERSAMERSSAMEHLSPQERADVRSHLDTCEECTTALQEVLPMAQLLPMANTKRVMRKPRTRPEVANQLFARIAAEKQHQRRMRYATSGLVGVAAVIIAAFLVVPVITPSSPAGRSVHFAQAPTSVVAKGRIVDESWGTEVHLDVSGLSGRQTVWFEQPDGTRASAGSFDGGNGNHVELVLSTSFKAANAVALCVSPPDKPATIRAPLNA